MAIAVVLLGLAGCGGPRLYPVHGKVTWEDGAEARELAGGLVICESVDGKVGARGDIEQDGSFQLSTYKPGDGVLPGKHRVAVVEYSPREPPPPPTIDRAFSQRRVVRAGDQRRADDQRRHPEGPPARPAWPRR